MAITIIGYYQEEISDWINTIFFYLREVADLTRQLDDVIRRDSILGIARKVEAHQQMLNQSEAVFYRIQNELKEQTDRLAKIKEPAGTQWIPEPAEREQNEMRRTLHTASREFLDRKFNCQNFLSETFGKRLL